MWQHRNTECGHSGGTARDERVISDRQSGNLESTMMIGGGLLDDRTIANEVNRSTFHRRPKMDVAVCHIGLEISQTSPHRAIGMLIEDGHSQGRAPGASNRLRSAALDGRNGWPVLDHALFRDLGADRQSIRSLDFLNNLPGV